MSKKDILVSPEVIVARFDRIDGLVVYNVETFWLEKEEMFRALNEAKRVIRKDAKKKPAGAQGKGG